MAVRQIKSVSIFILLYSMYTKNAPRILLNPIMLTEAAAKTQDISRNTNSRELYLPPMDSLVNFMQDDLS